MKFQVDRDVFAAALSKAAAIAQAKGMPILHHVLLKSDDPGELQIIATDLELSLWTAVHATVEETGSMAIPAKKAQDLVRGFMEDLVRVELRDNQAHMQCGKSRRRLPTINPGDFPLVKIPEELEFAPVDKASLIHGLSKCSYGIPHETDAYSISGLYLLAEDGFCRALATDGHRLVYQDIKGGFPIDLPVNGIAIPLKGVQQMLRYLDTEGEVSMADEESRVILRSPEGTLSVQLLINDPPAYDAVIPDERPFSASIDVEQLTVRLKSMAALAGGTWKAVKLSLSSGKLELSINSPENGSGEDELPIEYNDEEFAVAFDFKYLLELCKTIGGGRMTMEWVDRMHAVIFLEPKNPGCLHLIMPMAV